MKTRESGMPEESVWAGFFDPDAVLHALGLHLAQGDVVDLGCGYGTFALAAARISPGTVYALDIDPEMVARTRARAEAAGLHTVVARQQDTMAAENGLADECAGYIMLFNILHCDYPVVLLREAWRMLVPGGTLAVLHWNYDPTTPRGPSMAIRPRPEQCIAWAREAQFEPQTPCFVDLPPYHYGLSFRKPTP